MELSMESFLIVCPLLFLTGFVDSIGGGGGLISLPAFLMAGLPPHAAIATNKLGACGGTILATIRFIRNKCVSIKLAIPSVIAAIAGSSLGANLSLMIDEEVLKYVLVVVLPLSAAVVLNKKMFRDDGHDAIGHLDKRTYVTAILAAFVIGGYDGFYGPGTGTFLIIAFTAFANLSLRSANGQAKVINSTTNLTALFVFLMNGQVNIPLGLVACGCSMLGGYIGSGLALKNGAKIVKPIILFVLALLFLKVLGVI